MEKVKDILRHRLMSAFNSSLSKSSISYDNIWEFPVSHYRCPLKIAISVSIFSSHCFPATDPSQSYYQSLCGGSQPRELWMAEVRRDWSLCWTMWPPAVLDPGVHHGLNHCIPAHTADNPGGTHKPVHNVLPYQHHSRPNGRSHRVSGETEILCRLESCHQCDIPPRRPQCYRPLHRSLCTTHLITGKPGTLLSPQPVQLESDWHSPSQRRTLLSPISGQETAPLDTENKQNSIQATQISGNCHTNATASKVQILSPYTQNI